MAIIEELNESIERSNSFLAQSTEDILFSLKEKMNQPGTDLIAQRVYPKVEKIQALSKEAFDFIETIKVEIDKKSVANVFEGIGSALYDSLISYKKGLFKIDPGIAHTFQESFIVFSVSFDSSGKSQDDLYRHFFKGTSPVFANAILNKFQNNIRVNEERMIAFCHESIAIDFVIRDLNNPWPFVVQSSTIVQASEQIEITAGVALFNGMMLTKIFVYDRPVELNYNGVAIYRLNASSKPGKHYVPVKINYTDQDGRKQSIQKEMNTLLLIFKSNKTQNFTFTPTIKFLPAIGK